MTMSSYVRIQCKEHPKANPNGYVYKHRIVYEEYNKVCILPWVDVHHIDRDPSNNNIDNLMPLTHGQHKRLHAKKDKSAYKCSKCQKTNTLTNKKTGRTYWYFSKITGGLLCHSCRATERYRSDPEYRKNNLARKRERWSTRSSKK